jgi:mono/diheme cytochrome c family protein
MREPQLAPSSVLAAFALLGVACLAVFSWVYLGEQGAEWRRQQGRFRQLEATVKNPHQLLQAPAVGGIRQVWLPDLGRVDRCTTCHLGVDDADYVAAPQPFRAHRGTWLTTHPVERFGCTVCHEGQGQATDYRDAAHAAIPFVERPMRPLETIEASCGTCHLSLETPDAPRLSAGRRLVAESGCVSCHDVPGFEGVAFSGPALDSEGYKVRAEWLQAWLKDPKSYLARSKMGNFRLTPDEIGGLQAFLLSQRARVPADAAGVDWAHADTDKGKALFGELRCTSCHAVNGRGGTMGPELTNVGGKVRRDWLFGFLKDPHRDQPETAMLQYRLTDDQVRDLAAFLLQEYRSTDAGPETPPASFQDAAAVAAGRATFIKRGCASCHRLPGISAQGKIGPSLAGVADRDPDQLTYGTSGARHTADNYIFVKLLHPDGLGTPSAMPTFGFTPAEAATITIALAGLHKADLPASRVVRAAAPPSYRPQGKFGDLVSRYRCLSCHRINGTGGDLSTVPLDRIGSQLQHDYIVAYLLNPGAVRVSVEARMPVFHMTPEESRTIADYLSTVFVDDSIDRLDADVGEADVSRGQERFRELGCVGCHQVGLKGGYVGPDLSNTGRRLKAGWIATWLSNPQRQKPGTMDPNYGLSAPDIRALTAYLMSLGATPAKGAPRSVASKPGSPR